MSRALSKVAKETIASRYADSRAIAANLRAIETAVGGREALLGALLQAPLTEELSLVVGWIADPRNDTRDIVSLCADAQISVGQLMEAYEAGALAKARVAAIHHVAEHLPAVVEDAMTRARPYYIVCPTCTGGLTVPDPDFVPKKGQTLKDAPRVPCKCAATDAPGHVLIHPELDRQKFAVELGGLGPKKAPAVAIDNRKLQIGDTSTGGLVALLQGVDKLLYSGQSPRRTAEVVEAEVVPPPVGEGGDADPDHYDTD